MRRCLLAAAALAVVLPLAACGDSDTGSGSDAGRMMGSAEEKWVDRVCGEVLAVVLVQDPPLPDPGADLPTALQQFQKYLDDVVTTVDTSVTGLRGVGSSPIDGGDKAVADLVAGLEALKVGYVSTKGRVAAVDTTDEVAAQSAMNEAATVIPAAGEELGRALGSLEQNQAFQDAGALASNCLRLSSA